MIRRPDPNPTKLAEFVRKAKQVDIPDASSRTFGHTKQMVFAISPEHRPKTTPAFVERRTPLESLYSRTSSSDIIGFYYSASTSMAAPIPSIVAGMFVGAAAVAKVGRAVAVVLVPPAPPVVVGVVPVGRAVANTVLELGLEVLEPPELRPWSTTVKFAHVIRVTLAM